MVINTQLFNGYSNNSLMQFSSNSQSENLKDKNYKIKFNTENYSKNISSHNSRKKLDNVNKKGFSEILNSKESLRTSEKKSVSNLDKNDKVKDKISNPKEDVEEKDKDEKSDDKKVNDILEELLNKLSDLTKSNNLSQVEKSNKENDILKTSIEKLTTSDNNINLLQQLLKTDLNNSFDSDTLKQMKNLLQQLSVNLNDDKTENMNKDINDIISKIDKILHGSDEQGKNIITNEGLFKQGTSSDNSNSEMLGDNKSKEDKFLNSLIQDKNDSVDNKINLFASRTQSIQAQNTEIKGLAINKPTFTSDFIKDVRYMSINNIKELTVKVNPGNLGEITIKLVQEDGLMKVNLKANSKETADLLSQNLADIKKELVDQNIKISEVNIGLYNDDTTFFNNQTFGGQLSQEQNNSKGELYESTYTSVNGNGNDDTLEENLAMLNNNLDFLA